MTSVTSVAALGCRIVVTAANTLISGAEPVRVAVLDEPELVRLGIAGMLGRQAPDAGLRLRLVDPSEPTRPDLVLCDPSGRETSVERYLASVTARAGAPLVAFTWDTDPALVRRILTAGARAWVPKTASSERFTEALQAAHRGSHRTVSSVPTEQAGVRLSRREHEVLTLICRGHSNAEIAELLYVSVNSVKTYIRQIYQKTGVSRRAQAVAWGLARGF
ncbi:helix-turn-helix transcriptional regulator [Nocardioides ferulae]|uniref:helix-turn-helix transcriptional regulator n=1 Tax=Nocardioides ferulae TaxID=2340821 RepID=UPI000F86C857|nr:response regulator transcription factor [Nocardioides ferulae]